MVDVDAPVDVCRTEICEVAGVELSSAPRRPINYKTLLKKMEFVPYGENLDKDAKRLAYYKQIRGYIKAKVELAILAVRDSSPDGLPDHLRKVRLPPPHQETDDAPWFLWILFGCNELDACNSLWRITYRSGMQFGKNSTSVSGIHSCTGAGAVGGLHGAGT